MGKSWEFCKDISRLEESHEKCVLILNKHKKQLDKNSALRHIETNLIGTNKH